MFKIYPKSIPILGWRENWCVAKLFIKDIKGVRNFISKILKIIRSEGDFLMIIKHKFKNLFKPINIGEVFIKNRIALAPMGDFHQSFDPAKGTVNQRWINFLTERAKGGVGLLITGAFKVEDNITRFREDGLVSWLVIAKESMYNYSELIKYVHTYGAKIFFQLSAGPGRVTGGKVSGKEEDTEPPISVSDNLAFFRPNIKCKVLSTNEVEQLVKAFGRAAELVANAGADGVEIHGHEGYLIDEFSTSIWNRRKDKYGGDLKRRLTFAIEIVNEIKKSVGKNFPVTYRYGSKHFIKGPWESALEIGDKELGRDVNESIKMAKILECAGYDGLHVDTGCYEASYWSHPPIYMPHGFSLNLTSKIKKEVKTPVIAVGRLEIPEIAESAIREGKADIIALGRELLADPYWPNKVFNGEIEDIKFCIGCHECMNRADKGQNLTCAINPFCGNEGIFSIKRTSKKKRILIVGGGVSGMEAAIIADMRGHNVSLFEKNENLGGHLIEASVPDFKADLRKLLDWYKLKIDKLKIDINLNTLVTPDTVKRIDPDVVIVATGSTPIIPDIPGIKKPSVMTCIDALLEKKKTGDRVIIVGGGLEGSETALWLAKQGKSVTIIEMLPQLISDIYRPNRLMLLDLLKDNKVNIITNTKVQEITGSGVKCTDKQLNVINFNCDTVIIAVGLKPEKKLYNALVGKYGQVYEVGDSREPRKIIDAIWEASFLALNI